MVPNNPRLGSSKSGGGAERGDNPTLLTLLRMLRVYGRLPALEAFLPEPEISPMQRLEARRGRNRA